MEAWVHEAWFLAAGVLGSKVISVSVCLASSPSPPPKKDVCRAVRTSGECNATPGMGGTFRRTTKRVEWDGKTDMGLKDQALGEGTFDETTCLLLHTQGSGDNQRKYRSREASKATGLTSKDASHDQAPLLSIGEVKGGPPLVLGPLTIYSGDAWAVMKESGKATGRKGGAKFLEWIGLVP